MILFVFHPNTPIYGSTFIVYLSIGKVTNLEKKRSEMYEIQEAENEKSKNCCKMGGAKN